MKTLLNQAVQDLGQLLPTVVAMEPALQKLGDALLKCWDAKGKVLIAGNGGSATDAMHLAGEFSVRFHKDRRALAAIAFCDPAAITAGGNDYGFDRVFSRQIEALGNRGDVLIVLSTSGNSENVIRAIQQAKSQGLVTVSFLGRDGGKAKGTCDIEFLIPSKSTARIQECHKLLYHVLCEWIDTKVGG